MAELDLKEQMARLLKAIQEQTAKIDRLGGDVAAVDKKVGALHERRPANGHEGHGQLSRNLVVATPPCTGCVSAAPRGAPPTPARRPAVVFELDKRTPTKCSMECLDDEACQVMPTLLREVSFPAILSPRSENMHLLLPHVRKGNEQQKCLPPTHMKVTENNGGRPMPWPSFVGRPCQELVLMPSPFFINCHSGVHQKQLTVRVVAIIAEGVPESDAKQLISYARANNKVIIGPATVGGVQVGAFKIGDPAGTIDNIIQCKLYRPGSVGFVSKSGGMSNELYNTIARVTDGNYEGIAIGGDVFPGSTLSDHILRFHNIPQVKMMAVLGELGGSDEYSLVEALKQGKVQKPVVAWVSGTCARLFKSEITSIHISPLQLQFFSGFHIIHTVSVSSLFCMLQLVHSPWHLTSYGLSSHWLLADTHLPSSMICFVYTCSSLSPHRKIIYATVMGARQATSLGEQLILCDMPWPFSWSSFQANISKWIGQQLTNEDIMVSSMLSALLGRESVAVSSLYKPPTENCGAKKFGCLSCEVLTVVEILQYLPDGPLLLWPLPSKEDFTHTVVKETSCIGTFTAAAGYLIYIDITNMELMGVEAMQRGQVDYMGMQTNICCIVQVLEGDEYFVLCEASYRFYFEKLALLRKLGKTDHLSFCWITGFGLVQWHNTCFLEWCLALLVLLFT